MYYLKLSFYDKLCELFFFEEEEVANRYLRNIMIKNICFLLGTNYDITDNIFNSIDLGDLRQCMIQAETTCHTNCDSDEEYDKKFPNDYNVFSTYEILECETLSIKYEPININQEPTNTPLKCTSCLIGQEDHFVLSKNEKILIICKYCNPTGESKNNNNIQHKIDCNKFGTFYTYY